MKKLILGISLFLWSFISTAQSIVQPVIGYDAPPFETSIIEDSSLMRLSKIKLTSLYLTELEMLAMALPYSPFTLTDPDSLQDGLDIPESKYLDRKRDKIERTSENYGEVMRKKLYEIVPYSDKKDIVAAILFLRKINLSVK